MNPQDHLVNTGEGVRLAIPPNWRRNAVVVFSNGQEGEEGASVVVRRETLEPRVTLEQYMDGLLVELARTLPEFAILDRRRRMLDDKPALEFLYTLTAKGTEYEQRQICTLDMAGSVLSIVMSSTKKQARSYQVLWEGVLDSVILTQPAEPRRD